jgi:hypothetical protein
MSLWEFRQWVESSIPMWLILALFIVGAVGTLYCAIKYRK